MTLYRITARRAEDYEAGLGEITTDWQVAASSLVAAVTYAVASLAVQVCGATEKRLGPGWRIVAVEEMDKLKQNVMVVKP